MTTFTTTLPTNDVVESLPQTPRPQWVIDLRTKIDLCPADERLDLVATLFGLRRPSELPRPGEAARYEHRDWAKLADDFGLEAHAKTTHSHLFRHKQLQFIVLSPAGTSGDGLRGAMNTMTDFRASYRREVGNLLAAVDVLLNKSETMLKSFEEFKADIILSLNADKLPVTVNQMSDSKVNLGLMEPLSAMVKYLKIIKSEFGISFDNTFELCKMHGDTAEDCLFYAKNSSLLHDMDVSSEMIATVRDFLGTLRQEDKLRREQKRAEREARYAPKKADPVEELRGNTGEGRYRDECNKYGAEMSKIGEAISNGLARMLQLKLPTPPVADYSVHEEKIRSLTAHVAETEEELATSTNKIQELQQALQESEATNPWEGRMRDLVAKMTELLADNDVTNLLNNLKEARKRLSDARELITAGLPTRRNSTEN